MLVIYSWLLDQCLSVIVKYLLCNSLVCHLHRIYMLWFNFILGSNFIFFLFLGIVMFDYEFETKEDKIWTKDKIEPPQNIHTKTSLAPKQASVCCGVQKSDWSWEFNQCTIGCKVDELNATSAATKFAFVMSSSKSAWFPKSSPT